MRSHAKQLFLILFIFAIGLSACSMADYLSAEDLENLEDAELEDVNPLEVENALAEEGQAVVYYHYQMTHEHINFNIETELPITFYQDSSGHWIADAMGGTDVVLKMMVGGTEAGQCQAICNIPINIIGEGKIAPTSDTQCQLPMSFQFVAQEDWIFEGDCPDVVAAQIDCAALSLVMADPGVYTFTPAKPHYPLQKTNEVTQEATLKVINMPIGIGKSCGW